jgi:hypothetical protein
VTGLVLPDYGRVGIGTSLVEAACTWAHQGGDRVVTLTTFTDVPVNAPLCRRLALATSAPPIWAPSWSD